MTKVTISYAGADEPAAGLLAGKLEKLGYKVAHAPTAAPQTSRRKRMKANASGPVLVLWSRAYASAAARPKAALATLRLDAAAPPARLKAPAIDLRQWRGREDHRGWRKLVAALGAPAKLGAAKPASYKPYTPETAEAEPAKTGGAGVAILAVLFLLAAGGGAAWYFLFR